MKLIVNADDFGRNEQRNSAIDFCMKKGYCSNASLIINTEYTAQAIELSKQNHYFDKISLHLNLTIGAPLTSSIKNTSWCGEDGSFLPVQNVFFTLKNSFNKRDILSLREECEAQMRLYREYGFQGKHLDSHNWVHLHLPVLIAIAPLLKKYEFRSIRPMREGLRKREGSNLSLLYYTFVHVVMRICGYLKCNYSSNLEEFLIYYPNKNKGNNDKVVEVFTHPEVVDGKVMDMSWSYCGDEHHSMDYVAENLKSYKFKFSFNDLLK